MGRAQIGKIVLTGKTELPLRDRVASSKTHRAAV